MIGQSQLDPVAVEVTAKNLYDQYGKGNWGAEWEHLHPRIRAEYIDKVAELVGGYFATALPEVTSVEELDQLPNGSAVLSEKYIAQQEDEEYPCVFQKLYTGDWHRGGRSSDTHPDYFLPARVLYRPEVKA